MLLAKRNAALAKAPSSELWEAVARARRPETLSENAIRRLDTQADRVRRLFELGEYDEETVILKLAEIRAEQERVRELARTQEGQRDTEWCRVQLLDLLTLWDEADGAEKTKLLGGLFERIEAHVTFPERGTKFRTKRQADAVAALLAEHGHEVEWVARTTAPNACPRGTSGSWTGRRFTWPSSSKTSGWGTRTGVSPCGWHVLGGGGPIPTAPVLVQVILGRYDSPDWGEGPGRDPEGTSGSGRAIPRSGRRFRNRRRANRSAPAATAVADAPGGPLRQERDGGAAASGPGG